MDPVARMGLFSTPEFQVAVIQFEVFLAVWLLSGKRPLGSWLVALATFAGFAAVSFYQGETGQSSCGCFGRLKVSPWVAFGLDVLVLAVLVLGRPDPEPVGEKSRGPFAAALRPAAWGLLGILVLGSLLIGLAHVAFGSLPAAIAYLRGERISISPRLVDVGAGARGEEREVAVTVSNWTDQPIRLIGGTADCSCTVLDDLPVTIAPQESRSVSIRVSLSGAPGIFTRKAGFLIDDESVQRIHFRLTGQITRTTSGGGSPSRAK
ncbi:MAG: DUF1573 domain-containing protein [Gemmataceae bacterium]|nr:DUF1573 domain-containing protein [Gemmataceae bacterium]